MTARSALVTLLAVLFLAPALAEPPAPPAAPSADAVEHWGAAPLVIVGSLDAVQQGPTAQSFPPIYNHTLTVKVAEVLRGEAKPGDTLKLHHAARQEQPPTFPQGKRVLVAVTPGRGGMSVQRIVEADDAAIADAKLACSLPIGWTVADGKLRSPWASLGQAAWPKDADAPKDAMRCGVTGRPAFLLPPGVKLTVEHVPPAQDIKWTNPDGDGEYRITLTNTTDQPVVVPALRRVGDKVLWDECVVLLCQGKTYAAPGSIGVGVATEPVTLEPGAGVSHVINVLAVQGPDWPRGGYRIEFTFAIGDRAVTKSLYYMSKHHDALREKATAALKRGG